MKEKLFAIWKNKRARASILFFSYLLFFAFVFLLLGSSSKKRGQDPFYLNAILQNNYSFSYTISINDQKFSYDGDRYGEKSTFLDQGQNLYYTIQDSFYQVINDKLVLFDHPYLYDEFLDIHSVEKLLKHSTFYSKETFANGDASYHYEITTTSLYSLLKQEEADLDLPLNLITLIVRDGKTCEIRMDVSSYLHSIDSNIEQAKITLAYDHFSQIKNIEIPYEIFHGSFEF